MPRRRRALIVLVAASLMLLGVRPAGSQESGQVSAEDVREALAAIPGPMEEHTSRAFHLLETPSPVSNAEDSESAVVVSAPGAIVDVPREAEEGVGLLASSGRPLTVELPDSQEADSGVEIANATVAYPASDSANAVQAFKEGAARMLQVIENRSAPTSYNYALSIPSGATIKPLRDGSLYVKVDSNNPFADYVIGKPWAKDAEGRSIPSRYHVRGNEITLEVRHRTAEVSYPVVADPFFIPAWILIRCGVGFLVGTIGGYVINGWTSWLRLLRSGAMECIKFIIGARLPTR